MYGLFEQWNDVDYLHKFFSDNLSNLEYFKVYSVAEAIDDTIEDSDVLEGVFLDNKTIDFESVFSSLYNQEYQETSLSKKKTKRKNRKKHDCWLRIYAIRVDINLYIITGGAIKLTQNMDEHTHTFEELHKIEKCRNFLKENSVFDRDSFNDYKNDEL